MNLRQALQFRPELDPTPQEQLRETVSTYGLAALIGQRPEDFGPMRRPPAGSEALFQLLDYDQGESVHLVSDEAMQDLYELAPDYFTGAQMCATHTVSGDSAQAQSIQSLLGVPRVWLIAGYMPEAIRGAVKERSIAQAKMEGGLYRARQIKESKRECGIWRCSAQTTAALKDKSGQSLWAAPRLALELAPHPSLVQDQPWAQASIPLSELSRWESNGWQFGSNMILSLHDLEVMHFWHSGLTGRSQGAVEAASLSWSGGDLRCDQVACTLNWLHVALPGANSHADLLRQLLLFTEGESMREDTPDITVIRRGQSLTVKSGREVFFEDRRTLHAALLREHDQLLGMPDAEISFTPVTDPAPQIWAGLLERVQAQHWVPAPLG